MILFELKLTQFLTDSWFTASYIHLLEIDANHPTSACTYLRNLTCANYKHNQVQRKYFKERHCED